MKCNNCKKLYTITIHRGKVGKMLCPYCLSINLKKNVAKKQGSTSNASTPNAR